MEETTVTIKFTLNTGPDATPFYIGDDDDKKELTGADALHECLCRSIHEGDIDAQMWLTDNVSSIDTVE